MKNKERWSRWRTYGKRKFVFFYALFWATIVCSLGIWINGFLFHDFDFELSIINIATEFLARFPFFFIGGIIVAFSVWKGNEKKYQKYI
ncbi:hypothetical protein [Marinisporobacter balticus]|uniref:Uncharacterized protein n=1 Tax=Marinisporobacter balticus TaxID=2018667 RepID=A0A4R2KY83_9FIRM|nr:hypothetical protein [Marinisporobacter balticus]TCO78062.1 hypothetical protein EV214_105161 [Marinisporobacter balticus]